jgi:UPF0716 protein FxsA
MPTEQMLDGVLVLAGGILLLTPGFITDTLGFLLLISVTRYLIKGVIRRWFNTVVNSSQVHTFYTSDSVSQNRLNNDDDIEDADFR